MSYIDNPQALLVPNASAFLDVADCFESTGLLSWTLDGFKHNEPIWEYLEENEISLGS